MLLTNAAVLKFPMLCVGDVGEDGQEKERGGDSQTMVGNRGVTSFFAEIGVLVLHLGRCLERCGFDFSACLGYQPASIGHPVIDDRAARGWENVVILSKITVV